MMWRLVSLMLCSNWAAALALRGPLRAGVRRAGVEAAALREPLAGARRAGVEALLEQQLGYVPPNLLEVAAWTTSGTPAVIVAHPLLWRRKGVEPFPTTYWLTSPELSAAVGTVERDGGVRAAREAVFARAGAEASMRAAHETYAADRWALLSAEERGLAEGNGWGESLRTVGVAGLRDPLNVKCLHAHYGHWLATGQNDVGAWVHAALPEDVRSFALGAAPAAV